MVCSYIRNYITYSATFNDGLIDTNYNNTHVTN